MEDLIEDEIRYTEEGARAADATPAEIEHSDRAQQFRRRAAQRYAYRMWLQAMAMQKIKYGDLR